MLVPPWDHHWRHRCLKVGGGQIVQRRVQPLPIVDLLDEAADRAARLLRGAVGAPIDLFALQGAPEAFRLGVVVRPADPAHARLDPVGRKPRAVSAPSYCTPRSECSISWPGR